MTGLLNFFIVKKKTTGYARGFHIHNKNHRAPAWDWTWPGGYERAEAIIRPFISLSFCKPPDTRPGTAK